jgi:hypothetical protein
VSAKIYARARTDWFEYSYEEAGYSYEQAGPIIEDLDRLADAGCAVRCR